MVNVKCPALQGNLKRISNKDKEGWGNKSEKKGKAFQTQIQWQVMNKSDLSFQKKCINGCTAQALKQVNRKNVVCNEYWIELNWSELNHSFLIPKWEIISDEHPCISIPPPPPPLLPGDYRGFGLISGASHITVQSESYQKYWRNQRA